MAMIATETHFAKEISIMNISKTVLGLFETRRQRAALKTLSLSQLSDMGVNSKQADAEARRPIWDVPGYWKR